MKLGWIIIEILAVLIENLAFVYFLNSRYKSKRDTIVPPLLVWLVLSGVGSLIALAKFSPWINDISGFVVLLFFLFLTKQGKSWHKALSTILTYALIISSSLIGASFASILTNVSVADTLLYQDTSRLMALLLIKAMQVVIFFSLAKKPPGSQSLKKKSTVLFSFLIIIVFLSIMVIFSGIHDFDSRYNEALVWIATGLLSILIVVFLLYEMFVREEANNIDLLTRLQRLELESSYFKEIDVAYTDFRTRFHEYKNNLIAMRALIEHDENKKALDFIDSITTNTAGENAVLQTGNLVLDAVVSTKFGFARSQGIEVRIQAVYPEDNQIEDNDLCAIAGNLLDNAVEACLRIDTEDQLKFIDFTLLTKGKNITLSICNSYKGVVKKEGDRYITAKDKRFHGLGIQYVDAIVSKYQGHVLREYDNNVFETHVILPLVPIQEGKVK